MIRAVLKNVKDNNKSLVVRYVSKKTPTIAAPMGAYRFLILPRVFLTPFQYIFNFSRCHCNFAF